MKNKIGKFIMGVVVTASFVLAVAWEFSDYYAAIKNWFHH